MDVMADLALSGADRRAADRVAELLAGSAPLALAFSGSSSPGRLIDAVPDAAALTGPFPVTVSTEEVKAGKPSPTVYQAVVHWLGSDAACTVAIENCVNRLRSASRAGSMMLAIARPSFPPAPDALGPAATQRELAEVRTDLIAQLLGNRESGRA
jgi:beta-phosphoglucomutase-like phosphatase (HAD superfamily)